MLDSGKVTLCDIVDVSESGGMPLKKLRPVHTGMFENRIIGYNRRYAALGVNQDLAALIRIWRPPLRKDGSAMVQIGMVAILAGSEIDGQYRVDVVQPLQNFDGINITELSLAQMEDYYDVEDVMPVDKDAAVWSNQNDIEIVAIEPDIKEEDNTATFNFPTQSPEHPETFDVPAGWIITKIEVFSELFNRTFEIPYEFDISDVTHPGNNGEDIPYKRYTDNRGYAAGPRTIIIYWK